MDTIKTLKVRIKDKHVKLLKRMATDVNLVWNYCNEISQKAIQDRRHWLTSYELQKLTAGFSRCEGVRIGSTTVQQVCEDYVRARTTARKRKLRWRVSNPSSSKYSLGWVPFKAGALKIKNGHLKFAGNLFDFWDSYNLAERVLKSGSFTEDALGRWYLNVTIKVPISKSELSEAVGVDLGLQEIAVTSSGERLSGRFYREQERRLKVAQKARKKRAVTKINIKIANRRKDSLHKFSTALTTSYGAIFVGDVSSTRLVKTGMAKSTLDASWSNLKRMLGYKSLQAGILFEVIDERYTTQTCSCCGVIPTSSPKGRVGLRIREWTCSECGSAHDRDVNAARNILAAGLRRLEEGTSVLAEEKSIK